MQPSAPSPSLLRAKARDAYDAALSAHTARRLSRIHANVGRIPSHAPSAAAQAALASVAAPGGASDVDSSSSDSDGGDGDGVDDDGAVPRTRLPPAHPPPPGLTWVRVRTNLRTPEEDEDGVFASDDYVPYFGDSDAHLRSSNALYTELGAKGGVDDDEGDEGSDDSEVRQKRRAKERDLERDYSDVEEPYPLDETSAGQRTCYRGRTRAAKRVAITNVVDECGEGAIGPVAEEFDIEVEHVQGHYNCAKYRVGAWKKRDDENERKKVTKEKIRRVVRGEIEDSAEIEMKSDTIGALLCRQCYSFDCIMHGLDTSLPDNQSPDFSRVDAMSEVERQVIVGACSGGASKCWFSALVNAANVAADAAVGAVALSEAAKALYMSLRETMGDDFCRISDMLREIDYEDSRDLRCRDVGALGLTLAPVAKPIQPRQGGNVAKKKAGGKPANKEITAMQRGRRLDFEPCNHPGPCSSKNCGCVQKGVYCEKYCTCNHVRVAGERQYSNGECPKSFKGCTCKSATACHQNQCVCVSFGRECDPDLCKSCGVGNAPRQARACCNAGLRLGLRYRTVAGRSEIHGWGVYAGEDIPKNALIGEYLGEVIQENEAEKRGRVYDEMNYSFLFNITANFAIDSTRLGSKLKYCNHSAQPNCVPRLMRVGGDVRVGIYSKKAIVAFEELFFDYGSEGYGKTAKADWARNGRTSPPGDKKKKAGRKMAVVQKNVRSSLTRPGAAANEEGDDGDEADGEASETDERPAANGRTTGRKRGAGGLG